MKRLLSIASRVWIVVVTIAVSIVGVVVMHRLHGIFGSQERNRGESMVENIVSSIPKYVTYEVYGPANTSGMVSYTDEHTQAQVARFNYLPWVLTLKTTLPSLFASIVAQGDSQLLGCRITVNGELREQQAVEGSNAAAYCLVKAA